MHYWNKIQADAKKKQTIGDLWGVDQNQWKEKKKGGIIVDLS